MQIEMRSRRVLGESSSGCGSKRREYLSLAVQYVFSKIFIMPSFASYQSTFDEEVVSVDGGIQVYVTNFYDRYFNS